jgi:hypothetical protein
MIYLLNGTVKSITEKWQGKMSLRYFKLKKVHSNRYIKQFHY